MGRADMLCPTRQRGSGPTVVLSLTIGTKVAEDQIADQIAFGLSVWDLHL